MLLYNCCLAEFSAISDIKVNELIRYKLFKNMYCLYKMNMGDFL